MNNLLCCSLFLQYRVAYFIGTMQGIKMRGKHLQFLTGKALYSPAVTSYPCITICLFFAFLSFPPVDHELLTTWCFWLFSHISKTLLLRWQGHSHSGLKYVMTAWRKTPCSQTLKMEMPASCKRLRTLWDSSYNHYSAELPLHPVLLSLCLYQCSKDLAAHLCSPNNEAIWRQTHRLERSLRGHVIPPPAQAWVNFKVRAVSSQILNISRKGDFTTSVDNLFQCLTTLTVFFFFLTYKWNFPCCNLWPLPLSFLCVPLRRVWLCLLLNHSVMQLKAASRALPPPLLSSRLSKPSFLRLSSDVVCSCPQTILVILLWALTIFFMPFLYSFMQQHLLWCLLVSFITVHDTVHPNIPPINDKLFSSPPLLIHVSSHVLLDRREAWELWWLRRHSTFRAGNIARAGVQRGLSAGGVSSWRGREHEAKNGRKLDVVCKLRPNHHTDTINKLPFCSSDSIKITELDLESKLIGLERHGRLTKCMQYWKQRAISDLAKEVKTILAII